MTELYLKDHEQRQIHGPFAAARIRQLAATGRITPTWSIGKSKEGPWALAGSVRGLFPVAKTTGTGTRPSPAGNAGRSVGFATLHWSLVAVATLLPWLLAWPLVASRRANPPMIVRQEAALPTGWYLDDLPDAVEQSKREGKDLLVLFTTDWCGPCRKLKRDLAGDEAFRREVLICVVDCDEQKELSNLHQVRGIPDLRLYRNGEQVKRQAGYGGSLADLASWVQTR